jgi:hypothetical protein
MGNVRNVLSISVDEPEGEKSCGRPGCDKRIILK